MIGNRIACGNFRPSWAGQMVLGLSLVVMTIWASYSKVEASSGRHYVFVSDTGTDKASGLSPDLPVASFERGRDIARVLGGGTTIFLKGHFVRSTPMELDAADAGTELTAAPEQRVEIAAAGNAKIGILIHNADDVTISHLSLSGFAMDGISVRDSKNARILANTVLNTLSSAWSQGAIHGTGVVTGALIRDNVVDGADYAGVIVDTAVTSNVSNVVIRNNRVYHTCRKVADCGAIYIDDRGLKSTNILIKNNQIADFGPIRTFGRGIYLDDWASNVTVTANVIRGPGTYAFMIHGGNNNRIFGNSVDMAQIKQALIYQPVVADAWAKMVGNVVQGNRFNPGTNGGIATPLKRMVMPDSARPVISGNLACRANLCIETQ